MVIVKQKECPCGNFEYSIKFKNLGEDQPEIFCPFCGQEDDESTEALDRLLNKKKKRVFDDPEEE